MFLSDAPSNSSWSSLDKSDDSSRIWSVLLVNRLFLAMVAVIISLRMFTKFFMAMRLFLDDFLMIGSALCFIVFCALNLYAANLGFGNHIWNLPGVNDNSTIDDISAAAAKVQEINYVALAILSPAIILAKLSVIAILLRIFPPTMKALRIFLLGLSAVVIGCCLAQALMIILQCFPVQASWDIQSNSCSLEPLDAIVMGMGVLNVVTDVVICVTPIPYFLKLKLPMPQKVCLCGIFLSGLIACGISVGRLLSLRGLHKDLDVTYATVPYLNWSCVEVGLIIIAGSMPSLRPLLATILPGFFKEHNFTTLFASEKRITMFSESHKLTDADGSWAGSANRGTGIGTIMITKEYQIEEAHKEPRPRASLAPFTPLSQRFGPRAIVTCERVKSP